MNEIKFEVGRIYYSLVAREIWGCIKRTENTVTFLSETGAKHTLKTRFSRGGVEYACLGFIYLSAMIGK